MKNRILFIFLLICHHGYSQGDIPKWFLADIQNDIGTWIGDNSNYKNEQEPSKQASNLKDALGFFISIEGIWEGMPKDTTFISRLEYKKGNKEHFVFVNNDLFSKERKPFSHYEGVYFFNPDKSRIEFNTINKSEIHSGYCEISQDTIYHYATIRGKSGNVRAYSSAIVKIDNNTLAYYAVYGKNEEIPDFKFESPLIYRKIEE